MSIQKIIIYWIDHHPVFNTNINPQILSNQFYEIISFSSPSELKTQFQFKKPDILITALLNRNNENIFRFLDSVQKQFPDIKLIILSAYILPWFYIRLYKHQLHNISVINKNENINWDTLLNTILNGKIYKGEETLRTETAYKSDQILQDLTNLHKRHWQALFCFAQNLSDKKTGETMKISPYTANDLRKKIYEITACNSKIELIKFLFRVGFYNIEHIKNPNFRV